MPSSLSHNRPWMYGRVTLIKVCRNVGIVIVLLVVYEHLRSTDLQEATAVLCSDNQHMVKDGSDHEERASLAGDAAKDSTMDSTTTTKTRMCSREERLQRLQMWCDLQKKIKISPTPPLLQLTGYQLKRATSFFIVCDKHKLLYCFIPKTGTTTWKTILVENSVLAEKNWSRSLIVHEERLLKIYNITRLYRYSEEEIRTRLTSYKKFLVARHPLDRVISFYNDKFKSHDDMNIREEAYIRKHLYQRVFNKLRPNVTKAEINAGKIPSFSEFLTYLLDNDQDNKMYLNKHLSSYQDLCRPCDIDYDFIGKTETMKEDAKYFIQEYLSGYGSDEIKALHSHRAGAGGGSLKRLHELEGESTEKVHRLTSMYRRDIDMFGYSVQQRRDGEIVGQCGEEGGEGCC